ncbi:helix-turn-helix domain-containing protein [Cellvibrio fibrivorans]|jgi:AraC-like DNA-binding protein|uniref:AraC-like DNA-binding protein n=1 Tax=Cellvibrio fibrivorans TaxID=126350 RepID=A0ABU1V3P4_9GAMM|nr:helix-turn-helix domain-containing protein [Cellvibrio fibrivorans]MDR7092091.1 AraC-like DNA-binding protein [Cellvibrio fibrivorans]
MKTNFLNIHDLVLVLTAVECCVLAVLLNLLPAKHVQPRRILSGFFLLIALVLTTTLIVWNGDLKTTPINHSPFIITILSACLLLQGPVLYFYMRSLSQKVELLRWRNLVHLVPSLIAAILLVVFDINSVEWQPATELAGAENAAVAFVWALVKLSPLGYIIACVIAEYKLRDNLKHLYADISMSELKLADVVLAGFCLHWLWSLLAYLLEGWVSASVSDTLGIIDNYLTVMLVNGLFVFGLINTRQLLSVHVVPTAKPVQPTKMDHKVAIIEKAIHEDKLFLESNINLERFAEQIGLKPRDISAILKMHYQSNFFEFINRYRVEEAKRLLVLPELKDETILEIIYKSGFNSPSAFHRFFKRMVGVTPTEYRQRGDIAN